MTSQYKPKSLKVVTGAALVVLLLMLSGGGIFYLLQARNNTTSKTNASVVTPTASNRATPASTQEASQIPQPLFEDNFADGSKGWALGNIPGYTRAINNGTLILADTYHTILTESLPTNATYTDFMLIVTFTLLQANQQDSVGFYLRGDTNLDHDYRIDFFGNDTYAIGKEYLDANKTLQVQPLVDPKRTFSLNPLGQQNNITVIMKDSTLVMLINGAVASNINDTDYTKGQIALFVQNSATSFEAQASFSSVVLYPAPDQLPTG